MAHGTKGNFVGRKAAHAPDSFRVVVRTFDPSSGEYFNPKQAGGTGHATYTLALRMAAEAEAEGRALTLGELRKGTAQNPNEHAYRPVDLGWDNSDDHRVGQFVALFAEGDVIPPDVLRPGHPLAPATEGPSKGKGRE